MSGTFHAFDYLESTTDQTPPAIYVNFGDESFLKRLVLEVTRGNVLGVDAKNVPFSRVEGDQAEWRDVADELATHSLFGGNQRFVVISEADRFVSRFRSELENYVERHPQKSTGVLLVQVASWPANTRLYKLVDKTGVQVDCRAPQRTAGRRKVLDEKRLLDWLVLWSHQEHDVVLSPRGAELMLELVGPSIGLLDQELAKLALFVSRNGEISPELVRDVVGGWRAKTTWELIDATVDGNTTEALRQLDELIQSGENPLALFGSISWSLRRFAAATRIVQRAERNRQRITLPQALEQAGFRKWPRAAFDNAQRQLRQLGRERASHLYRWLLDADLALKSSHSSPDRGRFVIEYLIVRMSKQLAAVRPVRG